MSTYFDIACLDCQKQMGLCNTNRREDSLIEVVKHKEVLIKIAELDLRIDYIEIDIRWLKEHSTHRVLVKCEYEDFSQLSERASTGLNWDSFDKKNRKAL